MLAGDPYSADNWGSCGFFFDANASPGKPGPAQGEQFVNPTSARAWAYLIFLRRSVGGKSYKYLIMQK